MASIQVIKCKVCGIYGAVGGTDFCSKECRADYENSKQPLPSRPRATTGANQFESVIAQLVESNPNTDQTEPRTHAMR